MTLNASARMRLAEVVEASGRRTLGRAWRRWHANPRRPSAERYTARLRERDIFLDLANMEKSSDGALAFVHKWGLLDVRTDGFVEEIISASKLMEHRLNLVKEGDTA